MPFPRSNVKTSFKLNGLTLIELLAVISLIAILFAITVPIVSTVQNSAKTAKSLSNLRQIASAMQMYSSDNDGLYPFGFKHESIGGGTYWYLEIADYLDHKTISNDESNNMLISPFVSETPILGTTDNTGLNVLTTPSHYSVHGVICPSIISSSVPDPRFPVWNIKGNHSEIILVGEGTLFSTTKFAKATFTDPGGQFSPWRTTLDYSKSSLEVDFPHTFPGDDDPGVLSYRANDKALVAFLDGHVEAMERGSVKYRNVVILP